MQRVFLIALCAFAFACRSFDPNVFDARLRRATVDAYVDAIETQFGGLAAAEVTVDDLARRYRDQAIGAATPAAFYSVLRRMLADLDDPHATLKVSPQFWNGPVAEPEWVQFAASRGRVWVGIPAGSLRSPRQLESAIEGWLAAEGAEQLSDLDATGIAGFLRRSTAFGEDGVSPRAFTAPLEWLPVDSVDGAPVESPHDGELLVRGALGSTVRIDVRDGEEVFTIALVRNAGVFEETATVDSGVRRRLNPLELAAKLDPRPWRMPAHGGTRAPRNASRALHRARARSAFRRGERLPIAAPAAAKFGLEAWSLRTPRGVPVGYLRIGSFRPAPEEGDPFDPDPSRRPPEASLAPALAEAIDALGPFDDWVLDLTSNPGGSWHEAGLFVSYFLDPTEAVVPHDVCSVSEPRGFLVKVRTRETHRLARVDVERVEPRTVHVLVDQSTASAGEIVASTLRGRVGAVLVGERTAGAEFSTAEFRAPDGSVLRIGLSGGMVPPLESFQGRGLEPDVAIDPEAGPLDSIDLEKWRAVFPYLALRTTLKLIDEGYSRPQAAPRP